MDWYEFLFAVIVSGGSVILFFLAYPFWNMKAVRAGLFERKYGPVKVVFDIEQIFIFSKKGVRHIALANVGSAYIASNSNWTESRILEDALNLCLLDGARVKVPISACGIDELKVYLKSAGIKVEYVEVEAPAFLD